MSDSIVRASCPACGDLVLSTTELTLRLDNAAARYRFVCPHCQQVVSREVAPGIVHVLLAAGVHAGEPEQPQFTDADVASLLAELDRPDCLAHLRRSVSGS